MGPSENAPESSGPRWMRASCKAAKPWGGQGLFLRFKIPAMPHMKIVGRRPIPRILSPVLADWVESFFSAATGRLSLSRKCASGAYRRLLPYSRRGLPSLVSRETSGGLLPHLFTLALKAITSKAVCFCGAVHRRKVAFSPSCLSASAALCGVRKFLSRKLNPGSDSRPPPNSF